MKPKSIIFGIGFGGPTPLFIKKHKDIGGITDIEVGPDSYLYILHSVKHKGRYIELFLIDYNY
jgi:hypothetical protein